MTLTPEEIENRLNWRCLMEGCDEKVFTPEEIERGVHLTIAPDYCAPHDIEEN